MRLLVVGDSGVGKTSVVHMLAEKSALLSPAWTVGCATSVTQHDPGGGGPPVYLEFLDVGGQKKYEISRQVFYSRINGILLVFALNNRRSHLNLRSWLAEIEATEKARGGVFEECDTPGGHGQSSSMGSAAVRLRGRGQSGAAGGPVGAGGIGGGTDGGADADPHALARVPVLLIGNKSDQAHDGGTGAPLEGLEYDSMSMSALDPSSVPWDVWSRFVASLPERQD